MNKYSILSTDNNPDYYNLLPLACYSWKKIGYTPVIIFVNVPEEVRDRIMNACPGAEQSILDGYEGVKDSTLAQIQRLFAFMSYDNEDILITADADMVIAKDIFTHQGDIISYGFDLTGRSELPICYVKATAAKWRELMGESLIPEKAYSEKWEDYWSVDQQLLTQKAKEYGMDKITFVDRGNNGPGGLPTGRWDRHGWIKPAEIIDVHMKRNDWDAQFEVFRTLWPNDDAKFLEDYRNAIIEWTKMVACTTPEQRYVGNYSPRASQINIPDPYGFLQNIGGNWDNHRPLLLLALSLAKGDVYEFGAGDGSTPYLRALCEAEGRRFTSYESHEVWAIKCKSEFVKDWNDDMLYWPCSVAFIDHAPGEHRHIAIQRMADKADIIVIHDSEEGGAGDYKLDRIWHLFKYRLNYNKNGGGAGATAVSNKFDLNKFRAATLGQYAFDKD